MSTPKMICYWCREAPAVLCRDADGSILTLCEECRIVSDWPIAQPESAAPDLLEACRSVAAWFQRMKQNQYEQLVLGQTLESASRNWETMETESLDLEPLLAAIAKAEGR